MPAYSSVLNKINGATLATVVAGILSATACLGIIPHSDTIIQVSGFAGTLISALVMVYHAKPSTSLQALHTFVEAAASTATPAEKALIISAVSNYVTSSPVTTISNPTNTTVEASPTITPNKKS